MAKYECYGCCDDFITKPCVIIIPGDILANKYKCLVTPHSSKNANFKIVE